MNKQKKVSFIFNGFFNRKVYKSIKGFTFIELIIAIAVLAILSVLGFISYNSHLSSSRDGIRKSELSDMYTLLDSYKVKSTLPVPNKRIDIYSSGILIGFQGSLSNDILLKIGFKGTGKDPQDKVFYTYYLTKDLRNPGVMGFLENTPDKLSYLNSTKSLLISQANAIDYTDRYPFVFGKKLGILLDENNAPIQENLELQSTGKIELNSLSSNYTAILDNKTSISNSSYSMEVLYGTTITGIIGNSCEQYIEEHNGEFLRSGDYLINSNTGISVQYCIMDKTTGSGIETRIATCSGSMPDNSYATNGNTYVQTYNGTDWQPILSWLENQTSGCDFNCNSDYTWSGSISTCLQKIHGTCGAANLTNITTQPAIGLCSLGNTSLITGIWPSTWTCYGINGGNNSPLCTTTTYCMVGGMFPCILP